MNDPLLTGFILGYLTCAAGLVVGWHVAKWIGNRKAKRTAKVDKAAATQKREAELAETLKAFCAVQNMHQTTLHQPTAIELECRRQMGIDYTGPTVLFTK